MWSVLSISIDQIEEEKSLYYNDFNMSNFRMPTIVSDLKKNNGHLQTFQSLNRQIYQQILNLE